jgi:hypothetical protein
VGTVYHTSDGAATAQVPVLNEVAPLLDFVVRDPTGNAVVDRLDIEEWAMRALEDSVAGARVRDTKPG